MESHKVSKTVLVLTCLASSLFAFEIELYSEKDRRGQSIKIDVSDNDCSELPLSWQNGVVSVDTLGNCVQFYDEPKCKGSLTVIQPYHLIHQMDLSLINYAFRLRTASPCGPKLKGGRFVIQNAADASVMSALNKHGNFAKVFTVNATKASAIPKSQQWEVLEKTNNEYTLKPRENSDNYPVSFDEESLKKGVIKRKTWRIMSVGRGRYIIKDITSQRCLYKTDEHKVEEHSCRIWSNNQEWVFRPIFGDKHADDKPKPQVGDGFNFNILSKVATLRPPTKPPPQYHPIFYNVSKLAQIKKLSTAAPYTIKKKIKRGPRPKNKVVDEPSIDLKPPGLRPAIPAKLSSNNNFLLYKPSAIAQDSYLPEFVPSDDSDLLPTKEMIKSSPQYKQYMEVVKQYLAEQFRKNQKNQNQNNKNVGNEEEEEEEEEDEEETSAEDDDNASDNDSDSESKDKAKKQGKRNNKDGTPSTTTSEGLTDDTQNNNNDQTSSSDQPGFMSKVFTKFKSNFAAIVPSVPKFELPSIPSITNVLPTLPSLPSVPVPKLTLSFTKSGSQDSNNSNVQKSSLNKSQKLKSKSSFSTNVNADGNSMSANSGYTFTYSSGKNSDSHYPDQQHHHHHPKFPYHHHRRPSHPLNPMRYFVRTTTTTTKKPALTLGSWGIFG